MAFLGGGRAGTRAWLQIEKDGMLYSKSKSRIGGVFDAAPPMV